MAGRFREFHRRLHRPPVAFAGCSRIWKKSTAFRCGSSSTSSSVLARMIGDAVFFAELPSTLPSCVSAPPPHHLVIDRDLGLAAFGASVNRSLS